MMRSVESASSVFYHSQEEDQVRTGVDSQGCHREAPTAHLYDHCQDSVTDSSAEHDTMGENALTFSTGAMPVSPPRGSRLDG